MNDLRKAAKMALEALEMFCEHGAILRPIETKEALRQALAQPEQEPYGYFRYDIQLDAWVQNKEDTKGIAFYTAPPKREWVGLTDDEIAEYWGDAFAGNTQYVQKFSRIIEAKLKEENGG